MSLNVALIRVKVQLFVQQNIIGTAHAAVIREAIRG